MLKDKARIEALLTQGARAFMMMTDPVNVKFKTRDEADVFMTGYKRKQREWQSVEGNRATPPVFQN